MLGIKQNLCASKTRRDNKSKIKRIITHSPPPVKKRRLWNGNGDDDDDDDDDDATFGAI